ncbi:hypothetical protein SAY86_014112 [Trapa natans]|uniref:Uncharacterized protein n=1 Tax=Trapa natans TaxID=22666 RepID=A0AAN7QMJ1_TRANT|nr:hypothetical protein SAY86_014112 [Trapa natans]
MESEPKPEKEIHVEKESPVKDSDPNHDSSQPSQVPSADHDSGTSATGSDATDAQPVSRKVHWSPELVSECPAQPPNPYVVSDPAGNNAKISVKDSVECVCFG